MNTKQGQFSGVIPPLVTPMKHDESVDAGLLDSLVRYLLNAGINGIFLLGSSGEFTALSLKERERLIARTVELVDGKVPVLVGVTHCATKEALKMTAQAARLGAAAVVVAPPYYYPVPSAALKEHFLTIAEGTSIPLFLYNIPQTTKIHLDLDLITSLSEHEMIVGIKDSSGDFSLFQQLICYAQTPNFCVFQGHEELIASSLLLGADGVVPALGNVVPRFYLKFVAKAKQRDISACLAMQKQIYSLLEIYNWGSVYGALKTGLQIVGVWSHASGISMPLQLPTAHQAEKIREKLLELDWLLKEETTLVRKE